MCHTTRRCVGEDASWRCRCPTFAEQARQTGVEVILDGTGMRVDESGAWREKVYGENGRRQWVKIHVALDGERGIVLSVEVTGSEGADGTIGPEVMAGVKERVRQVIADGGYDWRKVYEALMKHSAGVKIVIPPMRGAAAGCERASEG
ncbi:MAG: transposase [Thermoproteota archaeon]